MCKQKRREANSAKLNAKDWDRILNTSECVGISEAEIDRLCSNPEFEVGACLQEAGIIIAAYVAIGLFVGISLWAGGIGL